MRHATTTPHTRASARLPAAVMLALSCFAAPAVGSGAGAIGETRIARWHGGRTAAFLLMFDDSMNTHVRNAIPALTKRGLTGTFYVNPGKHPYDRAAWERSIPKTDMVYGNHTWTHVGARDVAHLDDELTKSNDYIRRVMAAQRLPRLISFAKPGVGKGKWCVSGEELASSLKRHNLISRPPFHGHGAAIHVKTAAQMTALVDRAVASGGVEHVIFHGVGGEWISVALNEFNTFLDVLAARADRVWVTDHISAHRYAVERDAAHARATSANSSRIVVKLTADVDHELYDAPLTVTTVVPRRWKRCRVRQGGRTTTADCADGAVQYQAIPNGGVIQLERR